MPMNKSSKRQLILLDFSQILMSNAFVRYKYYNDQTMEGLYVAIINSLVKYNKKFYNSLIVLATDSKNNWREDFFEYYKQARKDKRDAAQWEEDKTLFNYDEFYQNQKQITNKIGAEGDIVIGNIKCEADDVIGSICHLFKDYHSNTAFQLIQLNSIFDEVIIVSRDKDFFQLQQKTENGKSPFVEIKQYDPIKDAFFEHLTVSEADQYKQEHILRGDVGDGIPNFQMPGNALKDKIRQKAVTKVLISKALDSSVSSFCKEEYRNYYNRNKKLIDLAEIPLEHKIAIQNKFLGVLKYKGLIGDK